MGAAAYAGHLGRVRAQPRTALAGNDAGIQGIQRGRADGHDEILEPRLADARHERNACAILCLPSRFGGGWSKFAMSAAPNPEFLRRAIALATQNVATGAGGPFAALIVRGGAIVAEAVNTGTA